MKNASEAWAEGLEVLIMAGGSGTRFWPKSRQRKPKQLLGLWDSKSLLEHTIDRFSPLVGNERIWIVTTAALIPASREVLGEQKGKAVHFLGEPAAKNTAPCILWGTLEIAKKSPDAIVAVMPADHFIGDTPAFLRGVQEAVRAARENDSIVTLGIKPSRPETGYGYIEAVQPVPGKTHPVKNFVEKPDLRTANRYVESGNFLWNAGMFIFKASVGVKAFETTMPALLRTFQANNEIAATYNAIGKAEATSIDYGVIEPALEKGLRVEVVPVECGWNDVGAFPALEEINCATQGDVVTLDSASNVVQTDQGLVALLGVNDLVVVRDGDVVLVAAKDRAQDVKALLEKVKQRRPELL